MAWDDPRAQTVYAEVVAPGADETVGNALVPVAPAASAVPFWGEAPDAYDTVVLAGVALPGIATVKGHIEQRVKRKTLKGSHGQTFTFQGWGAAEIAISLALWTKEHWTSFDDLVSRILYPPLKRGAPAPLSVSHPFLTVLRVRTLYVLKIFAPEEKRKHLYEVKLACAQFLPDELRASSVSTNTQVYNLLDHGPGALAAPNPIPPKPGASAAGTDPAGRPTATPGYLTDPRK